MVGSLSLVSEEEAADFSERLTSILLERMQPIEVSAKDKKRLDHLSADVNIVPLFEEAKALKKKTDAMAVLFDDNLLVSTSSGTRRIAYREVATFYSTFGEITSLSEKYPLVSRLNLLVSLQGRVGGTITQHEGVFRRNGTVQRMVRDIKRISPERIDHHRMVVRGEVLPLEAVYRLVSAKVDRTKALMRHNPWLADRYFKFSPALLDDWVGLGDLALFGSSDSVEGSANRASFNDSLASVFAQYENIIYRSIIPMFHVKPVPVILQSPVRQEAVQVHEMKYTLDSISPSKGLKGVLEHISEDSRLKAGYFVDEVLNDSKYDGQLRAQLAREAKASKWYTGKPDMEVRNTFDDLMLKAVYSTRKAN